MPTRSGKTYLANVQYVKRKSVPRRKVARSSKAKPKVVKTKALKTMVKSIIDTHKEQKFTQLQPLFEQGYNFTGLARNPSVNSQNVRQAFGIPLVIKNHQFPIIGDTQHSIDGEQYMLNRMYFEATFTPQNWLALHSEWEVLIVRLSPRYTALTLPQQATISQYFPDMFMSNNTGSQLRTSEYVIGRFNPNVGRVVKRMKLRFRKPNMGGRLLSKANQVFAGTNEGDENVAFPIVNTHGNALVALGEAAKERPYQAFATTLRINIPFNRKITDTSPNTQDIPRVVPRYEMFLYQAHFNNLPRDADNAPTIQLENISAMTYFKDF